VQDSPRRGLGQAAAPLGRFLPLDAILARYMLSSVCLSVRLSVTSRYCIETTGRIELVFATDASFYLSHVVLYGILSSLSREIMVLL